jgi:hypothetical protein
MDSSTDDQPEGWRQLQERAQQEKDPEKLAEIIEEMNRLLSDREKAARRDEKPSR